MYISKTTIRKILKEAGATRVSEEAVAAFHVSANRFTFGVAKKAVGFASHAKRKTVDVTDIKLAFDQ